jgi:hypothetical protein
VAEIRLSGRKSDLREVFDSAYWMAKLYLSDIGNIPNELNLSLQVRLCNIFFVNGKIKSIK